MGTPRVHSDQSLAWTAMVAAPADLRHGFCAGRPLEADPPVRVVVLPYLKAPVPDCSRVTRDFHEKAASCQVHCFGRVNHTSDCRPTGGTCWPPALHLRKFFARPSRSGIRSPGGAALLAGRGSWRELYRTWCAVYRGLTYPICYLRVQPRTRCRSLLFVSCLLQKSW